MKQTILFLAVFVVLFSVSESRVRFYDKGTFRINFGFDYKTSSSFYDFDGDQIIFERDTFNIIIEDTIPYEYNLKHSYELREYLVIPGFEYSFDDDAFLFINLPLKWFNMIDKYENDTNRYSPTYGKQYIRAEYSSFIPDYYEIGAIYRFNKGFLSSSFLAGAILPPTLKTGYQQDTINNFHIYNAYKFYAGIISTINFEKAYLEFETTYKYRTGDFNDIFKIKVEGGFTSVPNTALKGLFIYNVNLGGFENVQPANPRLTTIAESSLDVGASFEATISKRLVVDFSYLVRLGLTNTLNYGQLVLRTSYLLN